MYDVFGEKRLAFSDAVDKHNESILKMDKSFMHEAMKGFTVEEDVPEFERMNILFEKMLNPKESGYAAMKEKMVKESDDMMYQNKSLFYANNK